VCRRGASGQEKEGKLERLEKRENLGGKGKCCSAWEGENSFQNAAGAEGKAPLREEYNLNHTTSGTNFGKINAVGGGEGGYVLMGEKKKKKGGGGGASRKPTTGGKIRWDGVPRPHGSRPKGKKRKNGDRVNPGKGKDLSKKEKEGEKGSQER